MTRQQRDFTMTRREFDPDRFAEAQRRRRQEMATATFTDVRGNTSSFAVPASDARSNVQTQAAPTKGETGANVVGGAVTGGAAGSAGGPVGAAVGAGIGGAVALATGIMKSSAAKKRQREAEEQQRKLRRAQIAQQKGDALNRALQTMAANMGSVLTR